MDMNPNLCMNVRIKKHVIMVGCAFLLEEQLVMHHNIIKIHKIVLWDCQYSTKYPPYPVWTRKIISEKLSVPQNIVMDMNDVMIVFDSKAAQQNQNQNQLKSYKWDRGRCLCSLNFSPPPLPPLAHFSWDMKHEYNSRMLANPNRDHSHFPQYFLSSYEYLVHHQSEDSCGH